MKVQVVREKAEEAFEMYQATFYVVVLLPYKQNHINPAVELAQLLGQFHTIL